MIAMTKKTTTRRGTTEIDLEGTAILSTTTSARSSDVSSVAYISECMTTRLAGMLGGIYILHGHGACPVSTHICYI